MKRLLTLFFLVCLMLLPCKMIKADDSTQLTLSIDGADGQIDDHTYYVIQPDEGDTTTLTITGGGDSLDASDTTLTCTQCDGSTDDPSEDGDPTYDFGNSNGVGTQNGDTITWNIDNNTDTGSYTFSLDSVSQDYQCPSNDNSSGDGTAEDSNGTDDYTVIVSSVSMDFVSQGKDNDGNNIYFYIPDDAVINDDGTIEVRCDITISADSGLANVDLGTLSTDNDNDYFADEDGNKITDANIGDDGTVTVTLVTSSDVIDNNSSINIYLE